ncbi:MAG: hypothetical protein P0120_24785 [Nitrospira sp.]|nr:hypothetical protein [Nitrospira sp.]
MNPLAIVKLTSLMDRTSGSPDVKIGLIDGPVVTQHPDLAGEHLREIPGKNGATCTQASSATRPNSAQTYSTQSAVAAAKLMRMNARRHLPESPSTTWAMRWRWWRTSVIM